MLRGAHPRVTDVNVQRVTTLTPLMIRTVRGLRVTGVEATLVRLAHVLDSEALEVACEDARRRRLTSIPALRAYLDRHARPGQRGWRGCEPCWPRSTRCIRLGRRSRSRPAGSWSNGVWPTSSGSSRSTGMRGGTASTSRSRPGAPSSRRTVAAGRRSLRLRGRQREVVRPGSPRLQARPRNLGQGHPPTRRPPPGAPRDLGCMRIGQDHHGEYLVGGRIAVILRRL